MQLAKAGTFQSPLGVPVVLHPRQSFPRELGQRPFSPPARIVKPGVGLIINLLLLSLHCLGGGAQRPRDDAGSHVNSILLVFTLHGGDSKPDG